jgi:hypothetical protein
LYCVGGFWFFEKEAVYVIDIEEVICVGGVEGRKRG